MVQKSQARYVKLKEPKDVLTYVQTLINRIRRDDLELDPNYLGKITYLLNTWTSAFKAHIEFTEVKKIQERLDQLEKEKMK